MAELLISIAALALAMFLYAVRCYPGSANAHDSLAEAYETEGKIGLALEQYRTDCRLGKRVSNPGLQGFRKHFGSLEAKAAKE